MFEQLSEIKELFCRYGGHAMAAGLSLKEENLQAFRTRINEICTLEDEDFLKKVRIDMELPLSYISSGLCRELKQLEPFGAGNEEPLFAAKDVELKNIKLVGGTGNVLKADAWQEGCRNGVSAVYFGNGEELKKYLEGKNSVSLVYSLEENIYRGISSPQIIIKHFR